MENVTKQTPNVSHGTGSYFVIGHYSVRVMGEWIKINEKKKTHESRKIWNFQNRIFLYHFGIETLKKKKNIRLFLFHWVRLTRTFTGFIIFYTQSKIALIIVWNVTVKCKWFENYPTGYEEFYFISPHLRLFMRFLFFFYVRPFSQKATLNIWTETKYYRI